ncbi:hypothetical protein F4Z99_04195 [Candidatus Poribacteria bacterium]|nr:hypothetical protein [Candidatus Poribacteria bacterium]MYB00928.1 hypothetical protein [Candidatus Poribacteria bacterium]
MFRFLCLTTLICFCILGCETQNPICTDNYCVTGEIFPKTELDGRAFDEMPATTNEAEILALFNESDANPDVFQPVTIVGEVSWELGDEAWAYSDEDGEWLRQISVEIIADGLDQENRKIHVTLNKDTLAVDANSVRFISFFLGARAHSVRLTERTEIAQYKGDIIGIPTR